MNLSALRNIRTQVLALTVGLTFFLPGHAAEATQDLSSQHDPDKGNLMGSGFQRGWMFAMASLLGMVIIAMITTPVFAAGNQPGLRAHERYVVTEDTARNFLKLFHKAKKIAYSGPQFAMVEEAEPYIKSCCDSVASAVALLEKAGFEKLRYIDDPATVARLNRSYLASDNRTFDRFIIAEKSAGWWPFWDAFTTYSVSLLISNGHIEGVSARVSMETL